MNIIACWHIRVVVVDARRNIRFILTDNIL